MTTKTELTLPFTTSTSLSYIQEKVFSLEGIVDENWSKDETKLDIFINGVTNEIKLTTSNANLQYQPISSLPLGLSEDFTWPQNLKKELEETYLLPPKSVSSTLIQQYQYLPNLNFNLESDTVLQQLFEQKPVSPQLELLSQWDVLTGQHLNYTIEKPCSTTETVFNSTSMSRPFASIENYVLGNSSHLLFTPGGVDSVSNAINSVDLDPIDTSKETQNVMEQQDSLFTIPPGFQRGLQLPHQKKMRKEKEEKEKEEQVQLLKEKAMTSLLELAIQPIPNETQFLDSLFSDPTETKKSSTLLSSLLPTDNTQPLELDSKSSTITSTTTTTDISITKDSLSLTNELDQLLSPISSSKNVPPTTSSSSSFVTKSRSSSTKKKEWAYIVTDPMTQFHSLVPDLAVSFPFELDVFQKQAIYHLEQGHSVFVAAHTSAGKTVVAEYAIGLSQKHMTKTIYTSPIKALSNQKFRDLSDKYKVGLLTGDVQINTNGDCLIMTTEILRSMLYKGADLIRDIEFVIFDEVHYVNDFERGVVWEEVIILLPAHVKLILLSATVPNTQEFADWVGRTKQKDMYVISTSKRPVPLEHYLYLPSAKEYFKFVDAHRQFLDDNMKLILSKFKSASTSTSHSTSTSTSKSSSSMSSTTHSKKPLHKPSTKSYIPMSSKPEKNTFIHLAYLLQERKLLPTVIFSFSKKNCEAYIDFLSSMDFLTSTEKANVHVFFQKAISRLTKEDQQLPQLLRMKEMLSRGLGVHHGGLLPLVKEVVEMLFAKGVVKLLFATETFAMGVNMPAKCVVFASTRKHDGTQFRSLLPGEYIQMSGRAGRRGLDATGVVLILCMQPPIVAELQQMVLGPPTLLVSRFRLTFNMILNLLRTASFQVEDMMKRSFCEHGLMKSLPKTEKSYANLSNQVAQLPSLECLVCETDIKEYYDHSEYLLQLQSDMYASALNSPIASKAMVPGRIVIVFSKQYHQVIAVIVNKISSLKFTVSMLLPSSNTQPSFSSSSSSTQSNAFPSVQVCLPFSQVTLPSSASSCKLKLGTFTHQELALVTNLVVPSEVLKHASSTALIHHLHQTGLLFQSQSFTTFEYDWSKWKDLDFQESLYQVRLGYESLSSFTCFHCPDFLQHYAQVHQRKQLESKWSDEQSKLNFQQLEWLPEYQERLLVLKQLHYIDAEGHVLLKGRVACELHSCHELVLTELLFHNFFAAFNVPETIAMLSILVCQEKSTYSSTVPNFVSGWSTTPSSLSTSTSISTSTSTLAVTSTTTTTPTETSTYSDEPTMEQRMEEDFMTDLELALDHFYHLLQPLMELLEHHGLPLPTFNFSLFTVCYAWAQGISFQQLMNASPSGILEGSIVRTIVRIEETCREIKDAARLMGDASMFVKMQEASKAIKRDIVFCGSLYID